MKLLIGDQRIRNVAERSLDGLPIFNQGLLVLRSGELKISPKSTAGKNGLAQVCSIRPYRGLGTDQRGERAAASEGASARASQGNLGKELRLGDSNFGVRGDKNLLGFANVWASSLEKSRFFHLRSRDFLLSVGIAGTA